MIRIISGTAAMFQTAKISGDIPMGLAITLFVVAAAITLYGIISCNKSPTWY